MSCCFWRTIYKIKSTMINEYLFYEFWIINFKQMGTQSKVNYNKALCFFHPGLSAWHAKLLWVYSSQCLPPFRVQRLETHHSVSASEDMVNNALLYKVHRRKDSQRARWDKLLSDLQFYALFVQLTSIMHLKRNQVCNVKLKKRSLRSIHTC